MGVSTTCTIQGNFKLHNCCTYQLRGPQPLQKGNRDGIRMGPVTHWEASLVVLKFHWQNVPWMKIFEARYKLIKSVKINTSPWIFKNLPCVFCIMFLHEKEKRKRKTDYKKTSFFIIFHLIKIFMGLG